jgi:hypothetical protein
VITRVKIYSSQPDAPELPLGGFMPNDDPVQIKDITGLGPVKADIARTPFATGRGSLYQGSSVGDRNIVMTLVLNPDWADQTMASLRQMLYRYLMPQSWCKIRINSQELPEVDIEGYVESFEPNMFSQDPEIQVSIICPKPDFVEAYATILNGVVDDGSIEQEFEYTGTIETGFELRVDRTVDNPSYTGLLEITMIAHGVPQVFVLDPITIDTIKYFKLSTVRNLKRVSTVDYADGTIANKLAQMSADSVWAQIKPGENVFSIAAAEPGQVWTLAYFNRFGGL